MTVENDLGTPGGRQLAWLEHQVDHLRISAAVDVAIALTELRAADFVSDRAFLLGGWALAVPAATTQLLKIIAGDDDLSLELASTILGCGAVMQLLPDHAHEILARAYPRLTSPWRDAAADQPGVRRILRITEGEGYDSTPAPQAAWQWPAGEPFPAPSTVEGVQSRLNYLGFGCGPVNGKWNESTRRAFVRWQISMACEPRDFDPISDPYDPDSDLLVGLLDGATPDVAT